MILRRGAFASVLVSLVLVPVGCGGDPEQHYCDALSEHQTVFSLDGGPQVLLKNLSVLRSLAGKAPADLSDEWQVFLDSLEGLQSAIGAAHVAPGAIAGDQPSGVSDAQWAAIKDAADGVSSEPVVDALNGIGQQARDVCKLQLGLS